MAIILDADVIIRGEKGLFDLKGWLASQPAEQFEIAAITVAELWHGVERAAGAHRVKRQRYLQAIMTLLPVVLYTEETAYEHARIWAELEAAGKMIGSYDLIVAAAVLHHLRTDTEWREVFAKMRRALKPGGSLWIYDLVEHELPEIERLMRDRYGRYLVDMKDESYRDHVFAYVEQEDTPKPLTFQLDLLRAVGFREVEVLHKNTCYAAFGARQ